MQNLAPSCINLVIDPEDYLTYVFLHCGGIKNGDREGWSKLLPGHFAASEGKKYRKRLMNAMSDPKRTEEYILRGKHNSYKQS